MALLFHLMPGGVPPVANLAANPPSIWDHSFPGLSCEGYSESLSQFDSFSVEQGAQRLLPACGLFAMVALFVGHLQA